VDLAMFPIPRYTGYADLSPLNTESLVLSDAKITGTTVLPGGSFSWVKVNNYWQSPGEITK
jgi:hypothetical protein